MKIAVDKNQTIGSHAKSNGELHKRLQNLGSDLEILNLPFGDYCEVTKDMADTMKRRGDKLKKADLVGDIKIAVDRKADIDELCGNICGKAHARFRDECILAQKCGCKFYVVVENKAEPIKYVRDGSIINPFIACVEDLHKWKNPRLFIRKHGKQLYPSATRGITLQKSCMTMRAKYGVQFIFCRPSESGRVILSILRGEYE